MLIVIWGMEVVGFCLVDCGGVLDYWCVVVVFSGIVVIFFFSVYDLVMFDCGEWFEFVVGISFVVRVIEFVLFI